MRTIFVFTFISVFFISCSGKNVKKSHRVARAQKSENVLVNKSKKGTEQRVKPTVQPTPKAEPEVKPQTKPVIAREEARKISPEKKKKFSEYLVNAKYYSTNGGYYQKKYEDRILSMVGDFIEKLGLKISPGTFGFYFDKNSTRRDELYLGLDILISKSDESPSSGGNSRNPFLARKMNNSDYSRFAVFVIKENTMKILNEMYKHRVMLQEREIVGVVIGYKWTSSGRRQQVNIWLKEEDIKLTYMGKITVNEMLQRSTVTDTAGKVILLSI